MNERRESRFVKVFVEIPEEERWHGTASESVWAVEQATDRLLAIDVPPETDVHAAYALLEKGETDGFWDFEEGHCGHAV